MIRIIVVMDKNHIQDVIATEDFIGNFSLIYRDELEENFKRYDFPVEKNNNEVKRLLKLYPEEGE